MANKLELTWIGKDEELKIEPRILLENRELSNTACDTATDNMIIHGDNLLALKALEQKFSGKVKCIYIDPPYNTGNAFKQYDDNLEHSIWLNLMRPRLKLLKKLLAPDGTIWISIDADECHYLKVLCDEVFERRNFIDEVIWQRAFSPVNLKKTLSRSHDVILVYAGNYDENFQLNKLPRKDDQLSTYKNPDGDPRGVWTSADCTVGPVVEEKLYEIVLPSGRKVTPPDGRCWLFTKERFNELCADNRIWFGAKGNNAPRVKKFLSEVREGVVSTTLWLRDELGDNQEAKREVKAFDFESVFATPKPERLIERILTLATDEGDLVLDSFLGSGTTAAVAHKMRRRYIGVEMGDHAYTHCKLRLDKVISGEDKGGITQSAGWTNGGGYRFYELAPSLIVKDKFGNEVINKSYDAEMLASAMTLHEGFTYHPDDNYYWKQGKNGNAYLYTTTAHVTADYLASIDAEMREDEYLIVACKSFDAGVDKLFKRIAVKKIPQNLLGKCEFGRDNYNLNVTEDGGTEGKK